MNNKEAKPLLRFSGFSDNWEQRELGDCGETYTGLSGKTKEDFGHGDARFVTYMNVFSNPIADKDKVEAVEIDNSQNRVQYGDVFFTTSSETPEEVGMSCVWLENTENTYLNSFCFGYRPTVNIDPYFMAYILRSETVRKKIVFLAQGISRYNISKNKVMEIEIPLPSVKEQQLLGKYFDNLDNIITLHQHKYEKLKNIKKSMLEKMFPKYGEKKPEIRFAGFTDEWEQRKLSEMSDFITKGATPTTYGFDWVAEGIPFFRNDAIKDNQFVYGDFSYISEEANEALSRSEISGDDILVAITGDIGKVGIVPKTIKKANINQHTARVRIVRDAVPYFVYQSLAREEQQKIYQQIKTGLSMPQLSLEQIRETVILCPSHEEQTKIADILYNLDNLITLHQRKYEQLINIKKTMLVKMFPN